jgi:hypothetical protein
MMNLADLDQRVAAHHARVEATETASFRPSGQIGSPPLRSTSGHDILARLASYFSALRSPSPVPQTAQHKQHATRPTPL